METPTSPYMPAGPGQRWLIRTDRGALHLIESENELAELVRLGRVTGTTPVYAVADGPRPFGEVPDLALALSKAVSSEPPSVRHDRRSPERAKLSEELAVLNLPIEEDVEYDDEEPRRRWPKRLAAVVILAAVAVVGYPFVAPHVATWRSLAVSRLTHRNHASRTASVARQEPAATRPSAAIDPASAEAPVASAPSVAIAPTAAAPSVPLAATTVIAVTADSEQGENPAGNRKRHKSARHSSRHHTPSKR